MSRIANQPIVIPKNVKITINNENQLVVASGSNSLMHSLHPKVQLSLKDEGIATIVYVFEDKFARAIAGTTRAIIFNMVKGVSEGFTKKLQTVGVGYRAQVQGKTLILSLGFSHPVNLSIPQDLSVECPSNTEINISGADKQKVGQFAAEIRRIRPPEPYKGKGVRYMGETILIKETKKK